jgi:hypothetical protein
MNQIEIWFGILKPQMEVFNKKWNPWQKQIWDSCVPFSLNDGLHLNGSSKGKPLAFKKNT